MFDELEFIYETYSRTGSLEEFKKRYPDSILNTVIEKLSGDRVGMSLDEILIMCYELNENGIGFTNTWAKTCRR